MPTDRAATQPQLPTPRTTKIADLYKDMAILKEAQSAAAELLKKDRFLEMEEHLLLKEHIGSYLEGKTLEM